MILMKKLLMMVTLTFLVSAYVCSVTPFRKTYEATSHNEGLARTQVRRACQAEQNAIFCEDSDIKCRRYD